MLRLTTFCSVFLILCRLLTIMRLPHSLLSRSINLQWFLNQVCPSHFAVSPSFCFVFLILLCLPRSLRLSLILQWLLHFEPSVSFSVCTLKPRCLPHSLATSSVHRGSLMLWRQLHSPLSSSISAWCLPHSQMPLSSWGVLLILQFLPHSVAFPSF